VSLVGGGLYTHHIVRIYRQRGRFATKATKSRGKFRAERTAASG
jgi:hypothetical protein